MGCGSVGSPTDVHRGKRRTVAPPDRRLTVRRGVALPLSVPLPSLGRQQSGRHWRCAVHGGRGPPYHSGSCSPGFSGSICAASRCAGVGPLVLRGPHVGRRLERGGGSHSGSPLGWGGPIPLASGGVSRRGLPALVPGGGLRYPFPALFVSLARSLPARACGRGWSAAPGWGGGEGRPVDRSPGGPS